MSDSRVTVTTTYGSKMVNHLGHELVPDEIKRDINQTYNLTVVKSDEADRVGVLDDDEDSLQNKDSEREDIHNRGSMVESNQSMSCF